ncbi:MAG: right-handed parallel beta-helix repeat-containing protein [Lachnospiraceae bacterium]|nr:right-handed parallel beta-helix repeat-containing protein [Lachnospiraceae bacterium]
MSVSENRKAGKPGKDLTAVLPDGTAFEFWERENEYDRILYVSCDDPAASDENEGSEKLPFKTINRAASLATPGTKVLIRGGIYRECVRPAEGGSDAAHMISYEAYPGEKVVIRASERVTEFQPSHGWKLEPVSEFSAGTKAKEAPGDDPRKIWAHELDPDMFRGYNPFCAVNIIHDRLFIEYGKTDMTSYLNRRGCVYCDGVPLKQVALYHMLGAEDNTYWVEANGQTIHFRLKDDADPKDHRIEISVREQCFAPKKAFLSYIHVKGLICEHAATGGPVPQRGAISAFRGHHWIIEDCTVDYANTVAIDIGNECWHHEMIEDQQIGYSVIRGCTIRNAGVCGIAGLFAEHMLIEDNRIEGTGWQKMELSWEAGGIKLHNSVNGLIRRNIFRNTYRADHLWLDCGNENTRICCNLFLNGIEQREAIFIECTKEGINLIDNNIIWNVEGRFDPAQIPAEPGSSGWYKQVENDTVNGYGVYCEGTDRLIVAHNLIGKCRHSAYYAKPVSFRMGGLERGGTSRKAKILNNIIYDCGEAAIVFPTADNEAEGNLYLCMKGGYLRVMYPAPELCLDLNSWREFCGFDLHGDYAWFAVDVDEESGAAAIGQRDDEPVNAPGPDRKISLKREPEAVAKVEVPSCVNCDISGNAREELSLPGPFSSWEKLRQL